MGRFIYVAMSDPHPGRDDDLHHFYDEQHVPDVLDVPGFVSAQRFVAVEAGDGPPRRRRFLIIYQIEADDPRVAIEALRSRRGTEQLRRSDALDLQSMFAQAYAPITGRVAAAGAKS